ncbi:MAG: SRPBCC family protein [Geodermatophilaceae bacterium]|nr:SRPBCC family protein [Geodermatophilaceae bacterium]
MTTPQTGSRIIGSMRAENGKGTVRMEDVYDTAVADLWSTLTEPDRLSRWIAEVTGDLRPGGLFHARFTSGWDGTGRVEVCEPHRRILATMNPGADDETVIEATLADEEGKTRLVIEERGLPLEEVATHGAGWQAHIEDLASHLAGREAAGWMDRWTELAPRYRELADELT